MYTADNNEVGRVWGDYITVSPGDGWKFMQWQYQNPVDSTSDSLSFHWRNLVENGRLWLAAPMLRKGDVSTVAANAVVDLVSCDIANGEIMSNWWFEKSATMDQMSMRYQCCQLRNRLGDCTETMTDFKDASGSSAVYFE